MIHRHLFNTAGIILAVLPCFPQVAAEQATPEFYARTRAGKLLSGPINSLTPLGTLTLGKSEISDWVDLRQRQVRLPAPPTGPQIVLVNGDRIAIDRAKLQLIGETLTIPHSAFPDVEKGKVPLPSLAVLWLQGPTEQSMLTRQIRRLSSTQRTQDQLLLVNGDQLKGILIGIDKETFKLDIEGKTVSVERQKTAHIAFTSEGLVNGKPRRRYRVLLRDGTRLTLKSLLLNKESIEAETTFSAKVRFPLKDLIRVQVFDPSIRYLSDLQPTSYVHQPYLSLKWPLVRDGNVTGAALHHADGIYDKGLGMHSASRVSYSIPTGCQIFEASVVLDALTGKVGSVRIAVLLDDRKIDIGFNKELTLKSGPVPIRLDVTKAKKLTLVVDFGVRGNVGDHVNWLDARFLK